MQWDSTEVEGQVKQAAECKYEKNDRYLKEKFINVIIDLMMTKIIKELKAIKDTSTINSEQVILWGKVGRGQRSQTAMLESLKDSKDFDVASVNRSRN